MNINESIQYYRDDIEKSTAKLALYRELQPLFEGVVFPRKVSMYATIFSDNERFIEFFPGYSDEATKNLQPFSHELAQHFSVNLTKELEYGETSIAYQASLEANGLKYNLKISGVVPGTCRIENNEVPLTEDELLHDRKEAEKALEKAQEALDNLKTTKVVKKIVCHD